MKALTLKTVIFQGILGKEVRTPTYDFGGVGGTQFSENTVHSETQSVGLHLVHVCAQSFSRVWPFTTLQPGAHQAPLSMGFPRQEYCAAMSFSRGSSWARDRTCVSCIGRQILYHWATQEAQISLLHISLLTCVSFLLKHILERLTFIKNIYHTVPCRKVFIDLQFLE